MFALLFCRKAENDRERAAFGILIGGLTALAVLGHGSSLFALIGFAVAVIAFWAWPSLKTMIYGVGDDRGALRAVDDLPERSSIRRPTGC